LPEELSKMKFYEPADNQRERSVRDFLKAKWKGRYGY